MNVLKAYVAAIVAILGTFGTALVQDDRITWRTIVTALVVAIVAHGSVFITPNSSTIHPAPTPEVASKHAE